MPKSHAANLKIVIENSLKNKSDEDEMAIDEIDAPNMLDINDESVELEDSATSNGLKQPEFHVNLDKVPPTLKNTTLVRSASKNQP